MRLDKYLKVSRLIKRRTIANEACDTGRISVNGKVQKASYDVKVGDVISIRFGEKSVEAKGVVGTRDCAKRMRRQSYFNIYEKARETEKKSV